MAGPLSCDNDDGQPADVLVGNVQTGEQVAYCGPCFARFGLAMALAALPLEEIDQQLKLKQKPTAAAQDGEAPPGRRRKRPPKKTKPEPAEEPAPPELAEGPPAPENG